MKRSISFRKLGKLYNEGENCMTPAVKSIYHDYFPYFVEAELKKNNKRG